MNKYRNLIILLYINILVIILYGCETSSNKSISVEIPQPNEINSTIMPEEESITIRDTSSENANQITRLLQSGVSIEAQVMSPPRMHNSVLQKYNASLVRLNVDDYRKALLKSEIVNEFTANSNESRFHNAQYCFYETVDGESLTCSEDTITYTTPLSHRIITHIGTDAKTGKSNIEDLLDNEDLSFQTKEQAFSIIKQTLISLHIDICDYFECYPITSSWINNVIDCQDSLAPLTETLDSYSTTSPYSTEDECYYFRLYASVNGIPLTSISNGVFEEGSFVPGCNVEAMYSRKGIIYMCISTLFIPVDVAEEGQLISEEDAISLLDNKFSTIILDGNYTVERISFEYVPESKNERSEATLIPCWIFSIRQEKKMPQKDDPDTPITLTKRLYIMFDALTGREMLRDDSV